MSARRTLVGAATALTVLAASSATPAAPERDMVIRMGKGIGKIELGMTLPQVRRALGGRHTSVDRRFDFGSRGRYLDLSWELPGRTSWQPAVWTVGFRSTTRNGPLRVVRVSTTAVSQRTPRGLGIGDWPRELVRAYPNATCVRRGYYMPYRFDWVVVDDPRGGMTAFNLYSLPTHDPHPDLHRVVAVMVQRDWFSKGPEHKPCPPGWQRW